MLAAAVRSQARVGLPHYPDDCDLITGELYHLAWVLDETKHLKPPLCVELQWSTARAGRMYAEPGHHLPPGLADFCYPERGVVFFWVAVWELKLSYHKAKTILFTTYPYSGNLNQVP